MKKILFPILTVSLLIAFTACKPQAKTFKMDVNLVVQNSTDTSTINNINAILKKRLLTFGLKEKSISSEIKGNTIRLKLSGVTDTVRLKRLLTTPGNLEFRETYELGEVFSYLDNADKYLISHPKIVIKKQPKKQESGGSDLAELFEDESQKTDSLLTGEEWDMSHPLFGRLRLNTGMDGTAQKGSLVGFSHIKDTAVVNTYLRMPDVRPLLPADLQFAWSKDPAKYSSDTLYELHAIKTANVDGKAPVNGNVVVSALVLSGKKYAFPVVQISMNNEGAIAWGIMTRDNTGRSIAIMIDGRVVSSPRVMSEITGGISEISAAFTISEAEELADVINSGCLPASVVIEDN